jgi:hypothetical protein
LKIWLLATVFPADTSPLLGLLCQPHSEGDTAWPIL